MVGELVEQGQGPEMISPELVRQTSQKVLSKEIHLTEESIRSILDPLDLVKKRTHLGGPSPVEVSRMLDESQDQLQQDDELLHSVYRKLEIASAKFEQIFLEYLNN